MGRQTVGMSIHPLQFGRSSCGALTWRRYLCDHVIHYPIGCHRHGRAFGTEGEMVDFCWVEPLFMIESDIFQVTAVPANAALENIGKISTYRHAQDAQSETSEEDEEERDRQSTQLEFVAEIMLG